MEVNLDKLRDALGIKEITCPQCRGLSYGREGQLFRYCPWCGEKFAHHKREKIVGKIETREVSNREEE